MKSAPSGCCWTLNGLILAWEEKGQPAAARCRHALTAGKEPQQKNGFSACSFSSEISTFNSFRPAFYSNVDIDFGAGFVV